MTSPTDQALKPPAWLLPAFLLAMLALVGLTAWQWRNGPPVTANLLALLPNGATEALEQRAEQRMQEPLNRDLVLLVRHADEDTAGQLADELAGHLVASGLFEQVQRSLEADLPALRRQLMAQRLALLDARDREALIAAPASMVRERLERLYAPFDDMPLVPLDQDWFGLADLAQRHLAQPGNVQPAADGSLIAEHDGERWRVLRARISGDAFDQDAPQQVAALVRRAQHDIDARHGELLAAGGVLYAAHGQQQARAEASLIGSVSLVATLALLLLLFRTPRVLLVALPVLTGAISGAAACIALFGQIHVLTLVLGASLVGASIDFPLHFLSKSWTLQPWRSYRALRLTLPGLLLALGTNVIGYLALSFTPFPALTQVAVFSAAGLIGAFACATCLLPALLDTHLCPRPAPLAWARHWLDWHAALRRRVTTPVLLGLFLLFCLGGVLQVDFDDDLRQWVSRDPVLQQQAQRISQITGFEPTSQYFLIQARDADELLLRQEQLSTALDDRIAAGQLQGYLSLSQLAAPTIAQDHLHQAFPGLLEASQPLVALGASREQLETELDALQARPPIPLADVLAGPLASPWRDLWLGQQAEGGVAGLVSLRGLHNSNALAHLAEGLEGVRLIDRPAELNRLFAATQRQAALLKLAAAGLIFLLLCVPFGWHGALRCLAVPLLAALGSLATLGWLEQPLTLFGLFGLLLVTAIGVDYAILMREQVGGAAVSLVGTLLAAVTTWLSFGLLALSSTPVVSNFGMAVGLGLLFAFALAPWAVRSLEPHTC